MEIIKSPLIYMGSKYSLIEYIRSVVPKETDTFYDVFAGSFTVGINMKAKHYVCNDYSTKIIEILKLIHDTDTNKLVKMIDDRISSFGLDRTKRDSYYKFREEYNKNQNPLDLFILHCHSFMHGIDFNSNGLMNVACGDSYFNSSIRKKLIVFSDRIKNMDIIFTNCNYDEILNSGDIKIEDTVYCDPPYLITTAFYNREGCWCVKDEVHLYECLDNLANNDIRFVLSNVFKHKNRTNQYVIDFANKYTTIHVNKSYNGLNYLIKSTTNDCNSDEVIITNNKQNKQFKPMRARILW